MTAAITIHFRKPELTRTCIDSLLIDGWGPILVWDNSADDNISLRHLQEHYVEDTRVWFVQNKTNLGFGRGMNAALAELGSRGYIGPVLLINNDACVKQGMYSALHKPLMTATVPTLVAPLIMQDGKELSWLYYHPWLALVTRQPLFGSFSYLSGCCLLVHRADNAIPLFDEDFFMYGEDVELSWRWRREGGNLVILNRAWLFHTGSASSGQASASYETFLVNSHWLLAKKLSTGITVRMLFYALRTGSLFLRACLRALRYRSIAPLSALSEVFLKNK